MKNIVRNIDKEMWVIILLLVVIFSLWFLQNILSNSLYQNSLPLNMIEQETDNYKHENNQLYLIYLQKASYTKIYQEAKKQGYVSAPLLYLP